MKIAHRPATLKLFTWTECEIPFATLVIPLVPRLLNDKSYNHIKSRDEYEFHHLHSLQYKYFP